MLTLAHPRPEGIRRSYLLDFETRTLNRIRSSIRHRHFDDVNPCRHSLQGELTTVWYLPKRLDAGRAHLSRGRRHNRFIVAKNSRPNLDLRNRAIRWSGRVIDHDHEAQL